MAESEPTARKPATALVLATERRPWRGDEHRIQVEAAREAGLPADNAELESFTEGFKAGMVLRDPADRAIVLRGRTVLTEPELRKCMAPLMRFLRIPMTEVALRVYDGEFEARVSSQMAERAGPAMDAAKQTLKLWLGFGLLGVLALQWWPPAAAAIWGAGLLLGGYVLRGGLVNGRTMLAGRLVVALGMLAQEERLILPPAVAEGGA